MLMLSIVEYEREREREREFESPVRIELCRAYMLTGKYAIAVN